MCSEEVDADESELSRPRGHTGVLGQLSRKLHGMWGPRLGDICQGGTGQGETRKAAAQLEDQRLDGVRLQGQVVPMEAGVEQHLFQVVDKPHSGRQGPAYGPLKALHQVQYLWQGFY